MLKPTGSIYLHCDSHANSYLRMLMDAVFGAENFRNEIVWRIGWVSGFKTKKRGWIRNHDTILYYVASAAATSQFNKEYIPYADGYVRRDGKAPTGKGIPIEDTWNCSTGDILDSIMIKSFSTEKTGYATQKPVALYERIVKASSNPGDVVLDIFAGCATTAIAAERLNRRWLACDMAYRSWTMLKRRFALSGFALSDMTSATTDALAGKQPELAQAESYTIGPSELPARDDEDPEPFYSLPRVKRGQRKSARSASWSGRIPKNEAKELLVEKFGPYCWGCGWEAPKFPSGERDLGLLEVDHIWARNPQDTVGGSDELYNLALLHATCNRRKGNRLTLEELRRRNADDQRIYGSPQNLVHLGEATQYASEYILQRGSQPSLVS